MAWTPLVFLRRALLLIFLVAGLTWLFAQTSLYQRLQGWSEDELHRLLGPVLDMSNVVVIDIDEESIERLTLSHGPWPYSRDLYAHLLRHLKDQGARTFAIDILLAEARAGDHDLAALLDGNSIVAAAAFPRPSSQRSEQYLRQLTQAALDSAAPLTGRPAAMRPPALKWPDVTLPLPMFIAPDRARVGIITVRQDDDGTLRRLPLFHEVHGRLFPGFALTAWATPEELARMEVRGGEVVIGGRSFSVSQDGEVRLRFPSRVRDLRVLPLHQVMPAGATSTQWRGKTVFVGSSSILLGDFAHTPIGRMSGLVLSAVASQSLAAGNVLHPMAWPWGAALLLVAMLPALFWMRWQEATLPSGFVWALSATLLLVVPVGMGLFRQGYSIPWLLALFAGLFALMFAATYGMLRLRSERERLAYERVALQEASRMKGEFLAHMTHELRTPLTAVIGFNKINQLNDAIGSEQRRRNSAIIAANCEHLLKLVSDNLDLAKIEAGQMELASAAQSPEVLVSEVMTTLGPLAAEKGLILDAQYERPLPAYVWMDAMRVRQVLLNVLGNAVKFTECGRVDVKVSWRDDVLEITVMDTGPGIEASVAGRIFEPFEQGESGPRRRGQGSGLGLSIARRLVRLMGGELSLESGAGPGSRFMFWIPARVATVPRTEASGAGAVDIVRLSGHVLLAEDDEDIRALMQRELAGIGLRCHAVEDGLQAVHACEKERFDVLLMDLEMPIMSGIEAVQVLRANGVKAPIIALTAHGLGAQTEMALSHGFDAILVKPVSAEALALKLSAHMAPGKTSEHWS